MKKLFVVLFAAALLLGVGCSRASNSGGEQKKTAAEENRVEISADVYLCDDVYRTDDTPTHGSGTLTLSVPQNVLAVADCQLLLCNDGCDLASVVSRAAQGYAPAYEVVADGESEGNLPVFKFKMTIPEPMVEDLKNQGSYEDVTAQVERNYFYLLAAEGNCYAYLHLERAEGAEATENEAALADAVAENAEISLMLTDGE